MSPEVTTAGRRKRMCLGLRPMQWEIVGRSHSRMWEGCVVVESVLVSAGQARAVGVNAGQYVHVVDVEGGQVGDLFAFAAADESEFASAEHTRVEIRKLFPRPGDPVLTNRRRPIPFVTGDTSPGRHDMLYATAIPFAMHCSARAPRTGPAQRTCVRRYATAVVKRRWFRSRSIYLWTCGLSPMALSSPTRHPPGLVTTLLSARLRTA